jgi:hypothetical protein
MINCNTKKIENKIYTYSYMIFGFVFFMHINHYDYEFNLDNY